MNTMTRNFVLAAALAAASLAGATRADADVYYGGGYSAGCHTATCFVMPRLGFHKHFILHVGEQVANVTYGSIAYNMGLCRGDLILAINGRPLNHACDWNNYLRNAMLYEGGCIDLTVRKPCGTIVVLHWQFVGYGGVAPAGPVQGVPAIVE